MQMNKYFKKIIQIFFLFCISGFLYCTAEVLFRGYTFISMYILSGFIGIILMILNDTILDYDTIFEIQILCGGTICTFAEGITGLLINQDFTIWDYRNLPFTFFWGQCNGIFMIAWMIVACFGIIFTDWYEWKFMKVDDKPYYRIGLLNNKKVYFY